ncbi:MAG: PEP-CTERM/exosortase system-associated acyltransferase [Rhodospirillales bacterium]|nr:PEP-CTERM/exosortase system-associated acyltransferase [Rhodospirillales bacterium]
MKLLKEKTLGSWFSKLQQDTFYNLYYNTFEIVKADTELLRDKAFRLRHKVFYEENGFPKKAGAPEDMECDAHDDNAVHFLLIHKLTNEVAGAIRYVMPHEDRPLASLPLQELCDHPVLFMEDKVMQLGEISRLCMARFFRRREKDGSILPAYYDPEDKGKTAANGKVSYFRRRIPYAPLGLIAAAFEAALDSGRLDCVYAASPEEFEVFKKLGFDYRVLGPRLKGHGEQQPIIFNIKHSLDKMKETNPACWEIVSDRGRLHDQAIARSKDNWYERIFDKECKDAIMEKLM